MDLKEIRVEPEMEAIDFTMKPGGHLRVIAVDEAGKPIPKTRIFFQEWRGRIQYFEFDNVNDYADANGVWEWNEAPLDEIKVDICRPDGMQLVERPLIARDEEYVFRPPVTLEVSGTVVDAATQQPVKSFQVVPGVVPMEQNDTQWMRYQPYDATDGKYTVREDRECKAYYVRIEADGYEPAVSRAIKFDEGKINVDFALKPGESIEYQVLMPDGQPAAGAKVALAVAGSQVSIDNGDIDDTSTYHATRAETDATGRVKFTPQDSAYQLVVTHPSGYAHVRVAPEKTNSTIELTPWARLEGTFRAGPKVVPNVTMEYYSNAVHSYGEGQPSIFTHYRATTGPDGAFSFDRVFAGGGRLGRNIIYMVDEGATEVASSKKVSVMLEPGETKQVNVGGDGRPVIGKFERAKGFQEKVLWNFATIFVAPDIPQPKFPNVPAAVQNDAKRREAWWKEWQLTPEGQAHKAMTEANQRISDTAAYFTASVAPDGTFQLDDVPPGSYKLDIRFDNQQAAAGGLRDLKFKVEDDGSSGEAVDLGVLELQ